MNSTQPMRNSWAKLFSRKQRCHSEENFRLLKLFRIESTSHKDFVFTVTTTRSQVARIFSIRANKIITATETRTPTGCSYSTRVIIISTMIPFRRPPFFDFKLRFFYASSPHILETCINDTKAGNLLQRVNSLQMTDQWPWTAPNNAQATLISY